MFYSKIVPWRVIHSLVSVIQSILIKTCNLLTDIYQSNVNELFIYRGINTEMWLTTCLIDKEKRYKSNRQITNAEFSTNIDINEPTKCTQPISRT